MGHLRGLGDCPLAFGDNTEGLCGWDGKPMPKGRRRWCSEACSLAWGEQHYWTLARPAAVRRDGGRCVVCGRSPMEPSYELHLLAAILTPFDADWQQRLADARADAARYARPDRVEKTAWALAWDRLYLSPLWKAYRHDHELEVNHIEPRRGAGYQAGCWNHQSNLETLCHKHHVAVTRLQRAGVHGPAATLLGHRAVPAAMF